MAYDASNFFRLSYAFLSDRPVGHLHHKSNGTQPLPLIPLFPPAYCPKEFKQRFGLLLTAGRFNFLAVLHSALGLSQSCLRMHKTFIGFGVALSDLDDPLLVDSSALMLDP